MSDSPERIRASRIHAAVTSGRDNSEKLLNPSTSTESTPTVYVRINPPVTSNKSGPSRDLVD